MLSRRVLKHWVSFQYNDLSGQDKSGAIDRKWTFLQKNVPCNVQQINRGNAFNRYGIEVSESLFVICYNYLHTRFDNSYRFIINVRPELKIPDIATPNPEEIYILEFRGCKTGVINRNRRFNEYEVYGEWNNRWEL